MDYQGEVRAYFARKAERYDATDEQAYWRLSDELLWWLLENHFSAWLPEGARVLDAGGGTGRWTMRLLERRPDIEIVLVDLSEEMMKVAHRKLKRNGLAHRVQLVHGDLRRIEDCLPGETFDAFMCFHNVLGFVPDPAQVFALLASRLRERGRAAVVVPNRFHTAYFNLKLGRIDDAALAAGNGRGRFTVDMPEMSLFTPSELEAWCANANLEPQLVSGFPVLLYPGHDETQLAGSTASIDALLEHGVEAVLALEKLAIANPGIAARGNNLFLAAQRR